MFDINNAESHYWKKYDMNKSKFGSMDDVAKWQLFLSHKGMRQMAERRVMTKCDKDKVV